MVPVPAFRRRHLRESEANLSYMTRPCVPLSPVRRIDLRAHVNISLFIEGSEQSEVLVSSVRVGGVDVENGGY